MYADLGEGLAPLDRLRVRSAVVYVKNVGELWAEHDNGLIQKLTGAHARTGLLIVVSIMTCIGCGRLGFAPYGSDAAQSDAPTGSDGAAAECEQAWLTSPAPSTPQPVTSINVSGSGQYAEFVSFDGRTIYFGSTVAGTSDVYMAERPSRDLPFAAPRLVSGINSSADDDQLTTSADGLEAFLGTGRGGEFDIWRSTRGSTDDAWGPFSVLPGISSAAIDYNAILALGERQLYFAAEDRAGGEGMSDIWVATRAARSQPFGVPTPSAELNTPYKEASPTLISTGRVIVFTSDRPGGVGRLDLWYATRATVLEPFGVPQLVPLINTGGVEYTPYLSPDGCELFLSASWTGDNDIYVSKIAP